MIYRIIKLNPNLIEFLFIWILGQQPQQPNMFGNQSVDFNNAFNSNNTTTPSSSTNLMDDFLQPERQSNSSAGMTTDSARLTGDLDQGLQQMAQSLGLFFLLYFKKMLKSWAIWLDYIMLNFQLIY